MVCLFDALDDVQPGAARLSVNEFPMLQHGFEAVESVRVVVLFEFRDQVIYLGSKPFCLADVCVLRRGPRRYGFSSLCARRLVLHSVCACMCGGFALCTG